MLTNRPQEGFGLGCNDDNWSKAQDQSLVHVHPLEREKGLELYYNVAVNPGFTLTADLQVIDPGKSRLATETLAS